MLIRDSLSHEASSRSAVTIVTNQFTLVDQWCQTLLFRRLALLGEGRLTIADGGNQWQFGQGGGPVAYVRVLDRRFYREATINGSLGAGEAYLRGWWTTDDLTSLFRLFLRNLDVMDAMETGMARVGLALAQRLHSLHKNSLKGSRENIHAHYDLGNDFFRLFLDETMSYSAGIYADSGTTLLEASIAKIDRLCRKLDLQPGDHLLEIGTGWGAFAIHAARHYGCRVTTTTISDQQYEVARERIFEEGLENRITPLREDYRNLRGQFDKLVSVEMIEAVGREFLPTYLGQCCRLLKPNGLMALQGILMADHRYGRYCKRVDFIQRYVFPGSHLPSLGALTQAMAAETDFTLSHLEDITPYYSRTLRDWRERFLTRLGEVRGLGYPESFIRLWNYYLCYCEAGFEERNILNVQVLLSRTGSRREPVLGNLSGQCAT